MKTNYFKQALATFALLLVATAAHAYDVEINGIYYNLVPKLKQATVTYTGEHPMSGSNSYTGAIIIPPTVTNVNDGVTYTVTAIGDAAFCYSGITSIDIPNTITKIGNRAFQNSQLQSITIPNSVKEIGLSAFYGCSSLISATIQGNMDSWGEYLFSGCSQLSTVNLPYGMTEIPTGMFNTYCTSLSSIQLPNTITSIGDAAFEFCSSLSSINLPTGCTSIGGSAFGQCSSLSSINLENVSQISYYAFQNCTSLTDITCPGNSIGYNAFDGCRSLKTITLTSKNDIEIVTQAFANCENLGDVYCYYEGSEDSGDIDGDGVYDEYVFNSRVSDDVFDGSLIEYATLHVPSSVISEYQSRTPWKNFGTIKTIDPIVLPTTMDLVDGTDYTNATDLDLQTLTYTRTFNNTEWQALYVPFSMNYADWSADFDIARINDIHQVDRDEDGVIDETAMEIIYIKSGSTEPHTPYLIRAKSTGTKTITLNNTRLYSAEQKRYDVSSWYLLFTFVGTYTPISGTDMVNGGYYAPGGGELHPSDGSGSLSSYRWYLEITDRDGKTHNVKSIRIVENGETTGMTELETQPQQQPVYDLSGRQVSSTKKGMYIINGKKVLVK